jgi:hypothetical protein
MSFELILPFFRPIEPLLVDETVSFWDAEWYMRCLHPRAMTELVERFFLESFYEVEHESA